MDDKTIQDDTVLAQPTVQPITPSTDLAPANTIAPEEETTDKKMAAILAMEGEEGRLLRERSEKEKEKNKMLSGFEDEKRKTKERLTEIEKTRGDLEIKWIDLSSKKTGLQKIIDPILAAETKTEKDVQAKNQEEHATDDLAARQALERERQSIEAERQKIEKEKWGVEDKIVEINKIMDENKVKYQAALKEEYVLTDKIKEIDQNIKSVQQ